MKKFFVNLAVVLLLLLTTIATTVAAMMYLQEQEARTRLASIEAEKLQLQTKISDLETEIANKDVTTDSLNCYSTSSDGWVVINTPCQYENLADKITLSGVAFGMSDGKVHYVLEDADDNELLSGEIELTGDGTEPELFEKEISWDGIATTESGKLSIFGLVEDDKPTHLVNIPVKFGQQ